MIVGSYFLYAYPQLGVETRKIQGVISEMSPDELVIDITRVAALSFPAHPEIQYYRLPYSDRTDFILEMFVFVENTIVANTGLPEIASTDVRPGDSVYIYHNSASGVANVVLVGVPVLWY